MGSDDPDVKSNVHRFIDVKSDWTAIRYLTDAKTKRSYHTPPNDQQWDLIHEWFMLNGADSLNQDECKFDYPSSVQRTLGVRYEKYHTGDDVTFPALPSSATCEHIRDYSPGSLEKYGLWGHASAISGDDGNMVNVWKWADNDFMNMDFGTIQSFIEITIEKYSLSPMMFCFAILYKRPDRIMRHKIRHTLLLNNQNQTIVLVPVVDINSHVLILHTCEYSRGRTCPGHNPRCTYEVLDRSFGFKPQYNKRIRTKVTRSLQTCTYNEFCKTVGDSIKIFIQII